MVFYASIAVGALFLIMAIVNGTKLGKAPKKEKQQVKQNLGLYSFGVVFAVGVAIFAKLNGL